MSDIDKKLREILWSYEDNLHLEELVDEAARKIKQAFADEGYVHLPNLKPGGYVTTNPGIARLNGDGTLTQVTLLEGQEWYDRFEKELGNDWLSDEYYKTIMEAAKRASGLSNE